MFCSKRPGISSKDKGGTSDLAVSNVNHTSDKLPITEKFFVVFLR